jgi:UTP--glucose-1-phosphate uridylyltransferase
MNVTKAIIPAAGLGTRFLPVTKSMPKEMLPIIDKPVIHFVVEEAIRSGIEDIIIITGRGKRAIEDYFDASPELEMHLASHKNFESLKALEGISSLAGIHYIRQKEPLGLGDAILRAEKHIGDSPFAILLGDDIVKNAVPCCAQLIKVFERFQSSVIGIEPVPREKLSSYGIIRADPIEKDLYRITDIVEKPHPDAAPSNLGAIGRYVFTPTLFECLKNTGKGVGNEIQLTDAIKLLMNSEKVFGCHFDGKRYDTGDRLGYIETVIDFALEDERMSTSLAEYIKKKGIH